MSSDTTFTQTVPLEDLPLWSPWPARLLGLVEHDAGERTPQKIEREYNQEKYASSLAYLDARSSVDFEELRSRELGDPQRPACVSVGDMLYATTVGAAAHYYDEQLLSRIAPYAEEADIICDLGCGYGYHLWLLRQRFPGKRYWGGEYASNAVMVADRLLTGDDRIHVERFDLTDPAFTVPFSPGERVLVLTAYAIEQLPEGKSALERLAAIKGKTWTVCHFEPVFDWCGDDTLGLLRRAYTVHNDYNRDLASVLSAHDDVAIVQEEREFFGMNPLHPVSLLCWQ